MPKFVTDLVLATVLLLAQAVSAAAASSYQIQPGDTLQLQVLQDSSLNRQLLVLPDGSVSVPMVGTMRASGLTIDQLRTMVTKALTPNFASKPTVYLSVASLAPVNPNAPTGPTIDVYVMGEVAKPGMVEMRRGSTLLQALATAGGFTNFAAKARVELMRRNASGQQRAYRYDYRALAAGVAQTAIVLKPGDVIVVPQRHLFE